MNPPSDALPPRGLRIALYLGGAFVLSVVVAGILINSCASSRWEAMLKRREELIKEATSRDASRPVLRGTAMPGNAWDDYFEARRLLHEIFPDPQEFWFWLENRPEGDIKEAIVTKAAPALDMLFQGTRRARGQYPTDWNDGYRRWSGIGISSEEILYTLALWKSDILQTKGKFREAAETLLDLCQFGRDSEFNTTDRKERCGYSAYAGALTELHNMITRDRLSTEELKQAGRELELLDRTYPLLSHTIRNESLWLPTRCMQIDANGGSFDGNGLTLKSWKYGFSVRLMLADAVAQAERIMQPAAATDYQSWLELQSTFQTIERESEPLRSTLNADPGTWTFKLAKSSRGNLCGIRLLRIACSFLTTGEVPDFADPFGGKLFTTRANGRLRAWSVGPNGIDDGGVGSFWNEEDPPDVVLECSR